MKLLFFRFCFSVLLSLCPTFKFSSFSIWSWNLLKLPAERLILPKCVHFRNFFSQPLSSRALLWGPIKFYPVSHTCYRYTSAPWQVTILCFSRPRDKDGIESSLIRKSAQEVPEGEVEWLWASGTQSWLGPSERLCGMCLGQSHRLESCRWLLEFAPGISQAHFCSQRMSSG